MHMVMNAQGPRGNDGSGGCGHSSTQKGIKDARGAGQQFVCTRVWVCVSV